MLLFAAESTGPMDAFKLLSDFGSAALAAIAVWWLTNRHEAVMKVISEGHVAGQAMMSETIKKMDDRQEARDTAFHNLADKKIETVLVLANNIKSLQTLHEETNRRLESLEDVILHDRDRERRAAART